MTTGQIINDVITQVANKTGKRLDESHVSERAVYSRLKDGRIFLLYEKRRKGRDFTSYDIMTLPCVELFDANISECPWAPQDSIVKRTVYPIPRPLESSLYSVNNLDFTETYNYRSVERIIDLQGGRFNLLATEPIYTTQNIGDGLHVYILNDIHKESAAIRLVPIDPIEVLEYPVCGKKLNKECVNIFDQLFPIDADLRKILVEMTVQYFLTAVPQIGDIKQNLTDDTAIPPNNVK